MGCVRPICRCTRPARPARRRGHDTWHVQVLSVAWLVWGLLKLKRGPHHGASVKDQRKAVSAHRTGLTVTACVAVADSRERVCAVLCRARLRCTVHYGFDR